MLKHLLFIFFVALLLRVGLIIGWEHLVLNSHGGDYPDYVTAAKHIQAEANFSHRVFVHRPPLLPLLIYALNFNERAVLYANAIFGALTAALTYLLARQLGLAARLALAAGLVVAFDSGSIIYSAFLGSEPSANILLLLSTIWLLLSTKMPRFGLGWGLGAGAALVLSLLARPAIYLLWIPMGIWLLIAYRPAWRSISAFMLVSLIGVMGWIFHNGRVFDHYTVSSVTPYTMLYYRAAAVEHLATGQDINAVYIDLGQRVQEKLGRDPAIVNGVMYQYTASSQAEADALQAVSIEVFKAHPLVYMATMPVGFARMFGWTEPFTGWLRPLESGWNIIFWRGRWRGWYSLIVASNGRYFGVCCWYVPILQWEPC